MSPNLPGIVAPDLASAQKIADSIREMATRQPDELVRSVMEIAADQIERDLDLIATYHREFSALVDAATKAGER